jgi:hypothetical protein
MFLRIALSTALLLTWSIGSMAGDSINDRTSSLNALAKHFARARILPSGSRPSPPTIDLGMIVGLRSAAIRKALGVSDPPVDGYDFQCGAPTCWVYTYGPEEHGGGEETPSIEDGSNLSTIVITTGGPFLLVLGISANRVLTARWQGQK